VINLPEEVAPTPASPATPSAQKGDDNLIAAVSYLWILSLVILLIKKDSDYVAFHAKQGLVIFGASVVLYFIGLIIPFLWPIIWLLNVGILVVVIIGFIKAYNGERYKMPVVADVAAKINL